MNQVKNDEVFNKILSDPLMSSMLNNLPFDFNANNSNIEVSNKTVNELEADIEKMLMEIDEDEKQKLENMANELTSDLDKKQV